MRTLTLLIVLAAAPSGPAQARRSENLLEGPARTVLRYLGAVRRAGPYAAERERAAPIRQASYVRAKALTAPRTLVEIAAREARGEVHPLAPWRDAEGAQVLEMFQLVAVRRAPRGTAIVTVKERFAEPGREGAGLGRIESEYLVARVDGEWRVVDRRVGSSFDDREIEGGYAGFFDEPAPPR